MRLDERVRVAHADAWAAQGRLRAGAASLRDLRLMASGLPYAQWNVATVAGPAPDLAGAARFYAERGVPWGLQVPAGRPWRDGRVVHRTRLMGAPRRRFRPATAAAGVELRAARPADLEAVVAVDAAAFAADPEAERAWLEPLLAHAAVAELGGEPVATAYALATDERAGPCVYLGGVAVLPGARRRGIGAALSSWLLERAFAAGAGLAHLHPDSDEAARLYARLGFAEVPGYDVRLLTDTGSAVP